MRPCHTCFRIRARARAIEFSIARSLFTFGQVPVLPAFGPHHIRHFSIQESDIGKIAPRPPQISLSVSLAGDAAVREHETERLKVIGRSGRYVSTFSTVNITSFEPSGGGAENEINMTRDVAVFEILPPTIQ